MKLVFYTYSYLDRLNLPVADCLARIAQVGYTGIDESGTFGASDDPRSVTSERRSLLHTTAQQNGLSVEAVVTHAELTTTLTRPSPLDLKGSVDLARDLGASVVTFHAGSYVSGFSDEEMWLRVAEAIRAAARYAAPWNIALAVDGIWPPWIVHSPETLETLFDAVDEDTFGVNFDPSYLTLTGNDPVLFVRRFASRIRHVHLKDHVGLYPRWMHRIPGQGEMDYVRVFAALAEAQFTGSMAVECFTNMPFEEACDRGYAAMTEALREAGVK